MAKVVYSFEQVQILENTLSLIMSGKCLIDGNPLSGLITKVLYCLKSSKIKQKGRFEIP